MARLEPVLILAIVISVGIVIAVASLHDWDEPAELVVPAQEYAYFQETYQQYLSYGKQLIEAKAAIEHHLAVMTTNNPSHRQELNKLILAAMDIRQKSRELVKEYNQNAIQVSNDTFDAWELPRRLEVLP